MNIVEAYDDALLKRKRAKFSIKFGLTLIGLLAAFYAVTIWLKGWENDYLLSLVGFGILGFQTWLRWREYKFWDREITEFLNALSTYGGWARP